MPKISVIVPTYNLEDSIAMCLNSIISQTFEDIEIIVVDDGSYDNTRDILQEFAKKDRRIKTIFKENGGVNSARLAGASVAKGEWIGFVDGDDCIDPNMYEILYSKALEYDADISHCGYKMLYANGDVRYFYNTSKIILQDNNQGVIDLLEGQFVEPSLCNKLFKSDLFRSFFDTIDMDVSVKVNEDFLLNYYLFSMSTSSVYYDVCLYCYNIFEKKLPQRVTSTSYNKIFDPIKTRKIALDLSNEVVKPYALKSYINSFLNACNYLISSNDAASKKLYLGSLVESLKEHKDNLHIIGKKREFMSRLLIFNQKLYSVFYRAYLKISQ